MNTLCMARAPGRARFPSVDRVNILGAVLFSDCLNPDKCVFLCGWFTLAAGAADAALADAEAGVKPCVLGCALGQSPKPCVSLSRLFQAALFRGLDSTADNCAHCAEASCAIQVLSFVAIKF